MIIIKTRYNIIQQQRNIYLRETNFLEGMVQKGHYTYTGLIR